MRRVEVEFYDSNFMHGWEGDTEDFLAIAKAIGYLKSESSTQLTLVMAHSELGLTFAKLTIPKGSILSVKELRK